jgi:predicted nucleic acid-binding protein
VTVFVDSSALLALLDPDDDAHRAAADTFSILLGEELVTHNYVVVETAALVQSRLPRLQLRVLFRDLLSLIEVEWIGAESHDVAVSALLGGAGRRVSLVDRVSFEVMRRRAIETAFAVDRDFTAQGFRTTP